MTMISAAASGRPKQGEAPSGGSAVHEVASVGVIRTALVMAGGTGGHIFPGLALAEALRGKGWRVHWLGNASGMEAQLVPPKGFAFESVDYGLIAHRWTSKFEEVRIVEAEILGFYPQSPVFDFAHHFFYGVGAGASEVVRDGARLTL